MHGAGVPRGVALVRAELVEVVVVGDVLVGSQRLARRGERALHRLQLLRCVRGTASRPSALMRSAPSAATPAAADACHEGAPVQVVGLGSDLGGRNVGGLRISMVCSPGGSIGGLT